MSQKRSKAKMTKIIGEVLTDLNCIAELLSKDQLKTTLSQLNDPVRFWTILAEIEWAAALRNSNIEEIRIEPFSPQAGPDLHAKLVSRSVYLELKAPWGLQLDRKLLVTLSKIAGVLERLTDGQTTHVHLIDTFTPVDCDPLIKTIKAALRDKSEISFTVFYFGENKSSIVEGWWPFYLMAKQVNPEKIWIRRNFYELYPIGIFPSWMDAIQGYHQVPTDESLLHSKALFAIDRQPEDKKVRRTYAVSSPRDKGTRYDSVQERLRETKRRGQLPAGYPCIVIIEVSHLVLISEIDVLCACFGEKYTNQLLAYSFAATSEPPDPNACKCPDYVSALICYYRFPSRSIARLYSNPKATTPLNDEEMTILTSRLPFEVENPVAGYSYARMMLLTKKRQSLSEAKLSELLDSLFQSPVIHFIDQELLEPPPKVEFVF